MPLTQTNNQLTNNQPPMQTPTQNRGIISAFKNLSLYKQFLMIVICLTVIITAITILPRLLLQPSMLTVMGQGEIEFQPDKVTLIVSRIDQSPVSTDAIESGERKSKALIELAKGVGGQDTQVKQSFYQIQPASNIQGGIDYQVVNVFSVTFSQPQKTSELIKTLYQNGATNISNVTFGSSQEEALVKQARAKAIEDGKERAGQIAKASGKRLGKLVSIGDDDQGANSSISNTNGNQSNFQQVSLTKTMTLTYEIW